MFTSIDPSCCSSRCPPYNITAQILICTSSGSASRVLCGMTLATSSVLGVGDNQLPGTTDVCVKDMEPSQGWSVIME